MLNGSFFQSATRASVAIVSFAGLLAMTGCAFTGAGGGGGATSVVGAGGPKSSWGSVHGGQQPVVGSTVTIYLAGVNTPGSTNGYGSGATAIASTITDDQGAFNIPAGTYVCPTPARQAYIVASGGNPQVNGGANSNITLMAALGTCPSGSDLTTTTPFVIINEVTTVAAVWALQQFMAAPAAGNTGAPQIGAPNTTYSNGLSGVNALSVQSAVQGMNNAFLTAKIMADISTGFSPNANYNAYATPETAKINTLANILAYCVNSDPASSAHCQNLGTTVTPTSPSGLFTAVDTAQAAWYMAQYPTTNLTTLYGYVSSTSPFQPYLGVPGGISAAYYNDNTIAINYAPLGPNVVRGVANTNDFALQNANDVAIDMYGNAWFTIRAQIGQFSTVGLDNYSCTTYCSTQSVSELGVDGSVLVNQIASYTPSTTGGVEPLLTTGPAGGARTFGAFPGSVAIDLTNRAWVANTVDSVSAPAAKSGTTTVALGSVGIFPGSTAAGTGAVGGNATLTNGVGYFTGAQPFGLAFDGSNNVFMSLIAPTATGTFEGLSVAKMSATDGSGYTVGTGTNAGLPAAGQTYLDVDTNADVTGGIVWASNFTACPVTGTLFSGPTTAASTTTNYGLISQYAGGTDTPLSQNEQATAISGATVGAGTAGATGNCGATTANVGATFSAYMANPFDLAVDRNNGVWITNQYNTSTKSGFDGLTYISAATAASGLIPSSHYVVNGVLPSSATASTPTDGISGTTLTAPAKAAIDGNNNVWVTNSNNNSIAEAYYNSTSGTINFFTPGAGTNPVINSGTGAKQFGNNTSGAYGIGFIHQMATPIGVAVDASGNVWVVNQSNNGSIAYTTSNGSRIYTGFSTTVIVGAAGPVITPKALAVKYGKIGQKP